MPLNQLLHDEQVTLMRAAGAKDRREVESYRNQLAELANQISAYALRNHEVCSTRKPPVDALIDGRISISVPLRPSQLTGLDRWAEKWGVSRPEAAERLIRRGMSETSHLMRSS